MATFQLTIKTPEKDVFNGEVTAVSFDAEDGRVQVLAHHADFMTVLQFSKLFTVSENQTVTYQARSGIFRFDHSKNSAELLCLYCEEESEVNFQTAAQYLEFLRTELEKGDLSDYQVQYLRGEKLAVEKQVKGK